MDNLPEEILELILTYSEADHSFLRGCTSISRAFVPIAQRRFFSSIAFHSNKDDPSSSLKRISQLADLLGTSPHLLSYTTKLAYVVPTDSEVGDNNEDLRKEGERLENIIPLMTSLQCVSIRFYLGPSTWHPRLTEWGSIPQVLQCALRGLLSSPELTQVHCQDIGGLPFAAIPWTSLTTLCLNNVSIDSGQVIGAPSAFPLVSGCNSSRRPSIRPVLPLSDLVVTVLPSPWIDLLIASYRLENIRRLVLTQADDCKYGLQLAPQDASPRVDYDAEHQAMATLLAECTETLEELHIYLPHYDPCSRPDLTSNAPPFDLSRHRNLKLIVKRMIWPSPEVKSPAGWLLTEASHLGLDPTYASFGETASTIQSEDCKVILEFGWREDPWAYFDSGDPFGAIDAAFSENPSLSLLVRHNVFCAEIFQLADAKEDMDEWMERSFPKLRRQGRFDAGSSRFREIIPTLSSFQTCSSGHCNELFQEREWQEPDGGDDDDDDYGLFSCRITL